MKVVLTALISVLLSVNGMGLNQRPGSDEPKLSDADARAVRQLAVEFTVRFARTKDLAPITKDLYVKDFLERYLFAKSNVLGIGRSVDLDFVPGLNYNSRVYGKASPEDWLRFYTAANNLVFFGFLSGIKKYRDASRIKPEDLYPPEVVDLLNTNPNLSNMIVRKGTSKAVSSVDEMQKATATLEQAVSLLRQRAEGQPPLKIDEQELMKAMEEEKFFQPIVRTIDNQFFVLSRGTQVIFINTPILFRLIIVKTENKLEILWAEPSRD